MAIPHCIFLLISQNTYSLTHMNLSRNLFGEQAGVVLGPAISENSSLKFLDLSWNGIRRTGAKAVAEGIKVICTEENQRRIRDSL